MSRRRGSLIMKLKKTVSAVLAGALPTIAPSKYFVSSLTCLPFETPNPTQAGTSVYFFIVPTNSSKFVTNDDFSPVTPSEEIQYGIEKFFKRCQETGVDGLIIPDLPYEEKQYKNPFASFAIFLILSFEVGEIKEYTEK